jgi:serine/threonine protein phosphatase PrpC
MNDITIRRPIRWMSNAESNVGTVRKINEDSILSKPEIGLWVVADGMGGHEAGNVASKMIVDALAVLESAKHLNTVVDNIENTILDVNQRLLEYSDIMLEGRVVGSTFVCLVIHDQVGVCLWAGDSRLYLYRGNELSQLSRDHSEISELLQLGTITEEEAVNHPDSNVITRAVGTNNDLYVDIELFGVQLGDTFLLCSDGLYNSVNKEMLQTQLALKDSKESVDGLIQCALQNGASDNVSAIVIKGSRQDLT